MKEVAGQSAVLAPSVTEPVTKPIEAADVGLYRAKRDGKSRVAVND
ncbi:hypothetical protein [Paraburkholderia xenovorans]